MSENKGDLISREALKRALNYIYDCAYIDSKSKEGIASDIIAEIDSAPTVKTYCYFCGQTEHGKIEEKSDFKEGYKQAILDCKTNFQRQKGEWKLHGMIYYCSECGHDCGESGDNFCGNCGADMRGEEE